MKIPPEDGFGGIFLRREGKSAGKRMMTFTF
jgi:hypothetical protein